LTPRLLLINTSSRLVLRFINNDMAISEKLEADIITAMKAGDAFDVTTLRMLKAAILNKEIASRPKKLTEDDVVAVTQTEVKKRKEAAVEFTKGNRPELAEKETKEAELLTKYLPAQLSDDELKAIVKKAIQDTGAASMKDMGKVMAAVMPQIKGRADGQRVSGAVKEILV